jgi:uncharacterized Fe-S cluster protein YjdI
MIKKEYTNGETTVIWQPHLCIHSGVCFKNLPAVFKPRERPWIQMENDTTANIINTVQACPSGAISIKTKRPPDLLSIQSASGEGIKVTIVTNGPAKFSGPCIVTNADGTTVEKPNGVSICRCGGSSNKPFCDGSHKTNGFIG